MLATHLRTAGNVLFKPLTVASPPIHIQLEPTTYCNLNCASCGRSKYLTHFAHLSPEHFRAIVSQIRPLKITFSGTGEPFMNPQIFTMIAMAKDEFGCSINTTSNGTLLTEDLCEQIIRSRLDLLKISIDAATKETYYTLRRQDFFERILFGIRTLIELKKRHGVERPFIRFNYVISQENIDEIPRVLQLADTLGIDAIFFQFLWLLGIEERRETLIGGLTFERYQHALKDAIAASRACRVTTNLRDMQRKLPLYWQKYQSTSVEHHRICLLPWFSAYITQEGDMRPCCTCLHDYTTMGNLLESPLNEVWNGQKYQEFRRAIKAGKRPFPICETCVPQNVGDMLRYSRILPGFMR